MTLAQLREEQSPICWPDGESENLIIAHDNFYQEGLWSLNKWVDCYRFNHTNVFDHCATYFNCGMTVLPLPPGVISKVYVINRVNPETGEEDPTAQANWCCKVICNQVNYCHLDSYVRLYQRSPGSQSIFATADAIATALFGVFRIKRSYPAPTDEGMGALPPLPGGFHYPQSSTDASGRSPSGVWAINRGKIYLAPWIQSTESVVIEWNGIKSKWSPVNLIEDDIKFKEALRLFVGWKHESHYGEEAKAVAFKDQLFGNPQQGIPGALPEIIHECREQMRVRTSSSVSAGAGAAARGIGTGGPGGGGNYVNDQAFQYTAECPTGKTGDPVTVTVPAGTIPSAISVADANAKAQQKAQSDAQSRLVCVEGQAIYHNREKIGKAECPGASGDTPKSVGSAVSVTVQANTPRFDRTTQQAADDAAQAYADDLAQSKLSCTFYNAPAEETATCPEGPANEETGNVEAGVFHATTAEGGQARADALASAEAKKRAVAKLVCSGVTFAVGNTPKQYPYTALCVGRVTSSGVVLPSRYIAVTGLCPANFHVILATEATRDAAETAVNQAAQATAQQNALALFHAQCR